ncbi:Piso0_001671 [Millerozyma farinosa CBS 7064]|uniref:Altered inheritance of mitochondria protein 6 n=1 Tax=Pichia sorbitophila (strain ATCC MYA-4447 / BCRC 22081 / CBS 7064 / NBRC 10061 / NRRL Y-12695) TaxID=559304 RepID=G8YLE7_PICSO|nr:Piso0_001671 [Millerozyma farinosa CBS 7064]
MLSIFRPLVSGSYDNPYVGVADRVPEDVRTSEALTRDITVKPLHSHNDYWRKEPLFDALRAGCQSVEADVWYFEKEYKVERTETRSTRGQGPGGRHPDFKFSRGEVYVGHNQIYLKPQDTLNNLYLDPLFDLLSYANPTYVQRDGKVEDSWHESKNSVFYNSPETPLYFWLDIKTDPRATYNALKPHLKRFKDAGYLAYFDRASNKYVPGPVIVTLSGNIPWDEIENEEQSYVFVDAPLVQFRSGSKRKDLEKYKRLSVVASGSLRDMLGDESYEKSAREGLSAEQESVVKSYLDTAHSYGLKTRIWEGVNWPLKVRRNQLESLWRIGSDLLNVDDLYDASHIDL